MQPIRIFFAHRKVDQSLVDQAKDDLRARLGTCQFDDLSTQVPDAEHWKATVGTLLRCSDVVVCMLGTTTHTSKGVAWEIETAIAEGKPVFFCKLTESAPIPPSIASKSLDCAHLSLAALAAHLRDLRPDAPTGPTDPALLGQYTVMVQSWEALINRRQSVNQLYLSASAALITAIVALIALTKDLAVGRIAFGCLILSILGGALCYNWLLTIGSYGQLSKAKSEVVTDVERQLPLALFADEWEALESKNYKSTTDSDKRTIKAFICLFVLSAIISVGYWWRGPVAPEPPATSTTLKLSPAGRVS